MQMLHIKTDLFIFFFLPALQIQGDKVKVLKERFASYPIIVPCVVFAL